MYFFFWKGRGQGNFVIGPCGVSKVINIRLGNSILLWPFGGGKCGKGGNGIRRGGNGL